MRGLRLSLRGFKPNAADLLDEGQRQLGECQHALRHGANQQVGHDGAALGPHHDLIKLARLRSLGNLFGHVASLDDHVVCHTCFV